MEVILDTNFIVSCILKRIEFIDELEGMGLKVRVPRRVLQELKDLKTDKKTSREERQAVEMAFKILEDKRVKKIRIGGSYVDDGLIQKGKEGLYIATLDREIKHAVPNRVVIDAAKNSLKIERS
jgi:rRNA-processing protein FCF1